MEKRTPFIFQVIIGLILIFGGSNQSAFGQIQLGPALGTTIFVTKPAKLHFSSFGASVQLRKHSVSIFYERVTFDLLAGLSRTPQGGQINYRYKIAKLPLKVDFFTQLNFQYFSYFDLFSPAKAYKKATQGSLHDVFILNPGIGLERKVIKDLYLSLMIGGGGFYIRSFNFTFNRWRNGRGANYTVQLSARYLFTLKE